jgi:hypothetical protein
MDYLFGADRSEGGLQRIRKSSKRGWAQFTVTSQVYVKREHEQPCRTKNSPNLRDYPLKIRYVLQNADAVNAVNGFRFQSD